MQLFQKHSPLLLDAIIGLIFGAIAFFGLKLWYNFFQLTFSNEITFNFDPVGLLSLLVTVGLAVYVLRVLQRSDESDKLERELLISYFADFGKNFIDEVHRLSVAESVGGNDLAASFAKQAMVLQEILDLARAFPGCDDKNLSVLEGSVSKIRDLMTDTPREGEVEDGVRIENGRVFYSERHKREITVSVGLFRKAHFKTIAGINRS